MRAVFSETKSGISEIPIHLARRRRDRLPAARRAVGGADLGPHQHVEVLTDVLEGSRRDPAVLGGLGLDLGDELEEGLSVFGEHRRLGFRGVLGHVAEGDRPRSDPPLLGYTGHGGRAGELDLADPLEGELDLPQGEGDEPAQVGREHEPCRDELEEQELEQVTLGPQTLHELSEPPHGGMSAHDYPVGSMTRRLKGRSEAPGDGYHAGRIPQRGGETEAPPDPRSDPDPEEIDRLRAEVARLQEEIGYLRLQVDTFSTVDPETGALNRAGLIDALTQALHRLDRLGEPFALIGIGLAGKSRSEALRHVSAILTASVRALDRVANIGGGTLAVLSPGIRDPDHRKVLDRIRSVLSAGLGGEDLSARLAVIVVTSDVDQTPEGLLRDLAGALGETSSDRPTILRRP